MYSHTIKILRRDGGMFSDRKGCSKYIVKTASYITTCILWSVFHFLNKVYVCPPGKRIADTHQNVIFFSLVCSKFSFAMCTFSTLKSYSKIKDIKLSLRYELSCIFKISRIKRLEEYCPECWRFFSHWVGAWDAHLFCKKIFFITFNFPTISICVYD